MNKQLIDKALYESGLTAQGCWDELDEYAKQCIEKFAELLIQECCAVINEKSSIGKQLRNRSTYFGVE